MCITFPDPWIIVSSKSELGCGDTVAICGNGSLTYAEVVDKRPDLRGGTLVSESVARDLGLTTNEPFNGIVLDDVTLAFRYSCCFKEKEEQPGDYNLPNSTEQMA